MKTSVWQYRDFDSSWFGDQLLVLPGVLLNEDYMFLSRLVVKRFTTCLTLWEECACDTDVQKDFTLGIQHCPVMRPIYSDFCLSLSIPYTYHLNTPTSRKKCINRLKAHSILRNSLCQKATNIILSRNHCYDITNVTYRKILANVFTLHFGSSIMRSMLMTTVRLQLGVIETLYLQHLFPFLPMQYFHLK